MTALFTIPVWSKDFIMAISSIFLGHETWLWLFYWFQLVCALFCFALPLFLVSYLVVHQAVCLYLRDSAVVDLDQFVTKDIIPINEKEVVLPLTQEFPNFYNKEDLALPSELEPFSEKVSFMTAIDYIVYEKSDIFMPSHGGNHGL
ncbi:O-fucosyltransferase 20 [Vitis vinifera]|uniref:O-fucosyltransferase family protein n=1 Tax=Vitis vinifera TaxID=29760 RepID=A0A438CAU2_VITVI|nr:O-fucosyltransferase 20 [Vitis vinifera]